MEAVLGSVPIGRRREWEFALEAVGGEAERGALAYLLQHMPKDDVARMAVDVVMQNVELALRARAQFPWARNLSEALFRGYVLPYCVLDEERDEWRPKLFAVAASIVAEARSASEAVQLLNQRIFSLLKVSLVATAAQAVLTHLPGRVFDGAAPAQSVRDRVDEARQGLVHRPHDHHCERVSRSRHSGPGRRHCAVDQGQRQPHLV